MAESDLPYLGASIPQHQDQETHVPNYQQSYDFSPGSDYFLWSSQHYATAPRFQHPPASNWQRYTHPQQAEYQYAGGFPPAAYMGATSAGFQYGPAGTMADHHSDIASFPWFEGERNTNGSFNDQRMPRSPYPGMMDLPSFVVPPAHSHWVQPLPQYSSRRLSRNVPSATHISLHQSDSSAALDGVANHANFDTSETSHQPGVPSTRRISYQRPSRQGMQDIISQQRRHSFRAFNGSIPFPDLNTLPRSSNRRSFDRYSNDLQNDITESNGPARSPVSRAADRPSRRQRAGAHPSVIRARFFAQTDHPNVPSAGQMQALRDKLRHFLPRELPEGIDTMCDICQKDYSTKHVDPSEDDEIAIQLPCKHVFGEHCINTWFDTCKKHKNKITCPMCRKVLIEPLPRGSGNPSSRMFLEGLQRYRREEIGRQFSDDMSRVSGDQVASMAEAGVAMSSNFGSERLDGAQLNYR